MIVRYRETATESMVVSGVSGVVTTLSPVIRQCDDSLLILTLTFNTTSSSVSLTKKQSRLMRMHLTSNNNEEEDKFAAEKRVPQNRFNFT